MRPMIFLICCLLLGGARAAGDYSTPLGRVQDSVDKVVAVLRDPSVSGEERWRRIAPIIDDSFDFQSMSQSVLAAHWKSASHEERRQFTEFFSQYIEQTYREKIEAYTDEQVVYKSETVNGDRAVVETVIVSGGTEIPVNYKLRNNNGQWYGYDVVIEGVSLVANYRATFAAIAKNEGMDGLLADIQQRIDRHKAAQGTAPAAQPVPES